MLMEHAVGALGHGQLIVRRGGDVLDQVAQWSAEGRRCAIATVIATWGSSPRPVGSQLAVDEQGLFVGSVSGGCIEGAVIEEALSTITDGKPRRLAFGVNDERAWDVGLACGGKVEVFVERVEDGRPPIAALLSARAERRATVLATELTTGAQRLVVAGRGEGGAPSSASELSAAVERALVDERSTLVDSAGATFFLHVRAPRARLVIVGAVHIAQSLAALAEVAGVDVVVVDPRRAFATTERFAGVEVAVEWPDEALARLGPDRRTAVVTLTHDSKIDDPALEAALRSPAFYIGALGSRKTHAARLGRLQALGFSAEDCARVHGPVGLDIGAVMPAEIAVSIVAELVLAMRGGPVRSRVSDASNASNAPACGVPR